MNNILVFLCAIPAAVIVILVFSYRTAKNAKTRNWKIIVVGYLDILIGMFLMICFPVLGISTGLLGVLYVLIGAGLQTLNENLRKIFIFSSIPMSILASYQMVVSIGEADSPFLPTFIFLCCFFLLPLVGLLVVNIVLLACSSTKQLFHEG